MFTDVTLETLTGCARCGKTHVNLVFTRLTFAIPAAGDDPEMTHWTPCPTNGEPVLLGHRQCWPCTICDSLGPLHQKPECPDDADERNRTEELRRDVS